MVNAQQILAVIIPVKQYNLCPYDNDIFGQFLKPERIDM